MRVLVTINCAGVDASAEGGIALAGMLSSQGNTVLVQTAEGGPVWQACRTGGLDVAGPYLKGGSLIAGLVPFRRLVRRFAPDVICTTRADGQTAAALLFPGTPIVRIRCDIRSPRSGRLWRMVDRRTDLVVFPSEFMVSRGYADGREGPVRVIPHPVDTCKYAPSPTPLPERSPSLLSIGRLSPVKGHRTLVKALAMLPGVRCTIAGPPSQQTAGELMEFARGQGVAGRLTVTGRRVDVLPMLAETAIGVVTSLGSEVVSRAGMEMMSSGVPLLAAATNGLLDLVADGETGLLHSPGNHRQLAAQAAFLLGNPEAGERIARNARRFCVENLDLKAVGATWKETLEELAEGNNIPAAGYYP